MHINPCYFRHHYKALVWMLSVVITCAESHRNKNNLKSVINHSASLDLFKDRFYRSHSTLTVHRKISSLIDRFYIYL